MGSHPDQEKIGQLLLFLKKLGPVAVAFSGGVDSTLLLAAAIQAAGREHVAAVTASSATLTAGERLAAVAVAGELCARHVILPAPEFDCPEFVRNGPDRCYHCKRSRFLALCEWAAANGFAWVLDGSNVDDLNDYRPGMQALAEIPEVRSPLLELGWTKEEIRCLSRDWRLPTADRPSAACLASRIAYGIELTEMRLAQVEEAEELVRACSGEPVRVRHHGDIARIEVSPGQFPRLADPAVAARLATAIKALGFHHVALDLEGYRTGSMNAGLNSEEESP